MISIIIVAVIGIALIVIPMIMLKRKNSIKQSERQVIEHTPKRSTNHSFGTHQRVDARSSHATTQNTDDIFVRAQMMNAGINAYPESQTRESCNTREYSHSSSEQSSHSSGGDCSSSPSYSSD